MLKCYRVVEYYVPLHHAMVSKEIKFYCGNEKPLYMTYKSHTMIFQQIFRLLSGLIPGKAHLFLVLLYCFKPDV